MKSHSFLLIARVHLFQTVYCHFIFSALSFSLKSSKCFICPSVEPLSCLYWMFASLYRMLHSSFTAQGFPCGNHKLVHSRKYIELCCFCLVHEPRSDASVSAHRNLLELQSQFISTNLEELCRGAVISHLGCISLSSM